MSPPDEKYANIANRLSTTSTFPAVDALNDHTCCICQETSLQRHGAETPIQLACGHVFGFACILQWTFCNVDKGNNTPSCPQCRAPFLQWEAQRHDAAGQRARSASRVRSRPEAQRHDAAEQRTRSESRVRSRAEAQRHDAIEYLIRSASRVRSRHRRYRSRTHDPVEMIDYDPNDPSVSVERLRTRLMALDLTSTTSGSSRRRSRLSDNDDEGSEDRHTRRPRGWMRYQRRADEFSRSRAASRAARELADLDDDRFLFDPENADFDPSEELVIDWTDPANDFLWEAVYGDEDSR